MRVKDFSATIKGSARNITGLKGNKKNSQLYIRNAPGIY